MEFDLSSQLKRKFDDISTLDSMSDLTQFDSQIKECLDSMIETIELKMTSIAAEFVVKSQSIGSEIGVNFDENELTFSEEFWNDFDFDINCVKTEDNSNSKRSESIESTETSNCRPIGAQFSCQPMTTSNDISDSSLDFAQKFRLLLSELSANWTTVETKEPTDGTEAATLLLTRLDAINDAIKDIKRELNRQMNRNLK